MKLNDERLFYKQSFEFLKRMPRSSIARVFEVQERSCSQLRQDLLALVVNDFKTNGFFVEFGATDGIGLSNSYLLEKEFSWRGILAEPARSWHQSLTKNRTAIIETDCVWSKTGEDLDFVEAKYLELSGIEKSLQSKKGNPANDVVEKYTVKSTLLNDLLIKHDAPSFIDYISIDTEGSELDILNEFYFPSTNSG